MANGKVTGLSNIHRNINNLKVEIGRNTEKALTAIMMTARGYAIMGTPVDTSTLINSIDFNVGENGAVLYYRGGFADNTGFNFAYWLETNETWKPTKKPSAGPHFLRDAFESPEAKADFQDIIKASYQL